MRPVARVALALSCVSLSLLALASRARADGPYEGEWRAGPMRIEVAVESWGGDCGPRPQSTTVPGGRSVQVTQSGDDLTFAGRPQRTTRGCWSENAAVRRVSSRYQSGTWTIVCRTPAEDPRAEVGTYTLRAAGSDRIEFRDVSRYDWALNTSHCIATITSTQTFERVSGPAPQPTPDPTPETQPTPRTPACTPGAAARIAFRPAQVDVEPGGRACFTARVVDASGCALAGRSPALELRAPEGATGRLRGSCFEAPGSAAEAEGEYTIVAREGAMEAQARVRVRTPDLSDLIARRAEGGGAVARDDEETVSEEAARVAARSEGGGGRLAWGWVIAGALLGLLMVGGASAGLMARERQRKRRRAERERSERERERESAAGTAAAGGAGGDPMTGTGAGKGAGTGGDPMICPACRRGYPPGATRCETDGTSLVRYADFVAASAAPSVATGKVCPVCGERFPATTRFCGKDGATLIEG